MKASFVLAFVLSSSLDLLACGASQPELIEGVVVDNFGKPVAGASVEVKGSQFTAKTRPDGSYALDYAPGQFAVIVKQPGFVSVEAPLNISQKVNYKLAPLTVTRVPPADGLRLAHGGEYTLIPEAVLPKRKRITNSAFGAGCLERRLPTDIPVIKGEEFLAFAAASGDNKVSLIQARGGVVSATSTNMMAICDEPKVATDIATTIIDTQVMLKGKLKPGAYCFAGVREGMLTSSVSDKASCFRWNEEDPVAAIRPLLTQIRSGLAGANVDGIAAAAKFPLSLRDIVYGSQLQTVASPEQLKEAIAAPLLTEDISSTLSQDKTLNLVPVTETVPKPLRSIPEQDKFAWYRLYLDRTSQEYNLTVYAGFAQTAPPHLAALAWERNEFGGD